MATIYKNILDQKFLKSINTELDRFNFKDSLWIFPNENPYLHKKIKSDLSKISFFKNIIANENNYIVLRLVNDKDTKRSLEAHFDNYIHTYYIPLKLPNSSKAIKNDLQGHLYYWNKARPMPRSIFTHIFSKGLFQNRIAANLLQRYFMHKFKRAKANIGDVVHFNGFTSLHYNTSVASEHRSLVIHNTMPFEKTKIARWIDAYSRNRVKK